MRTTQADLGKHLDTLVWLHRHCFPADPMPEWADGSWWITWEDGRPVAFVGVEPVKSWPKTIYISRVGTVVSHRGKGLQRRLMNKVVKAAEGLYERVISSTYENPASANNFIRCGFVTYLPQVAWGAPGTIYWIKELQE